MRLLVLLLLSTAALAQQTSTTMAPCSPIAPDNNGSITINCPGISQEQGRKMLVILNRILANEIDPEVVMVKLDEIQHGVTSIEKDLAETKRKEYEAEKKRRTAPIVKVNLVPKMPGKVDVCIISDNLIPFQYRFIVTATSHSVLGGFSPNMETFYPTADVPLVCITKDIDLKSIPDHTLVVSFVFKSLSYDELHLPGHGGQAELRYAISDDGSSLTLLSNKPYEN